MICSLHVKLARAALNLTQEKLAKESHVSSQTKKKMETANPNEKLGSNKSTIIALVKFFEDSGVEFLDENDSVGVRIGKNVVQKRFQK
jgi:DNA-binding XRE family transcriptional regulator